MAAEAEIERMVVRLIGDSSSFRAMLLEASNASRMLGQELTSLGKSLTIKLTVPLALMGAAAVKSFSDFDKAMTESTSIMSVTTDQIERMRETALSLSGEVTQGPAELAKSYFFLASAGKNAEQAMALLPKVSEFATAGAFDMAKATDLLTDAQSALGLSSKNVSRDQENLVMLSDVLVKANTLANASVQQFSEALTNEAGAAMRSFNVDTEEGIAVLAAYADQGVKGNQAGSSFSRMLRLLTKGARDNADAFEAMNISVFDAQGNIRNLGDVVEDLERALGGMSTEQKGAALEMLGFEALAQNAILPLLGTSDAIRGYEEELRNAGGTTKEVADKQMKSFHNQLLVLKNQLQVVGIEIATHLAPLLLKLNELVKEGIGWWKGLTNSQKDTIVKIGVVAGAIGPLTLLVGGITSKVGGLIQSLSMLRIAFVSTGVGAVVIALGALAAWLATDEEALKAVLDVLEPFKDVWKEIQSTIDEVVPTLKEIGTELSSVLVGLIKEFGPIAKEVIKSLVGEVKVLAYVVKSLVSAIDLAIKTTKKLADVDLGSAGGVKTGKTFGDLLGLDFSGGKDEGGGVSSSGGSFLDGIRNSLAKYKEETREATQETEKLNSVQQEILDAAKARVEARQEAAKAEKEAIAEAKRAAEEAIRLEELRKESISNTISSLQDEIKTMGMSRKELALYRAEQLGATDLDKWQIGVLQDRLSAFDEEKKAKEELRLSTEKAREEEERFLNSIRGYGIEGVGRGAEASARIEESIRNRAFGVDNVPKGSKAGTPTAPMNLEEMIAKGQEKQIELLKEIAASTSTSAEKEVIELVPSNLGGD